MYNIEFAFEALEDLKSFKRFEQQKIISGIDEQLAYEPTVETRIGFKIGNQLFVRGRRRNL